MNEITTMQSVTRTFARTDGPRRLAIGLAVVCAALLSAVWASARPAPSSGATPHELRYLLQTRMPYPSDAALRADRAVLIQRLTSSGIAHARLLLRPPRRIEGIGAATALELAGLGARLVITDRSLETCANTVACVRGTGGQALPVAAQGTQQTGARGAAA